MTFNAIDLSKLPGPDIVETLSAENELQSLKDDLIASYPAIADALNLESEPMVKFLELVAYRITLLKARVNTASLGVMIAHATGNDLDNLAAVVPLERKVLAAGNADAIPPIDPTYETDDEFRARITLAPYAFSVAGPAGAYKFHALSAHSDVKDVAVDQPSPGVVRVTILSRVGNGIPTQAVLDAVTSLLTNDDVRPLGDSVQVQAATVASYDVTATLTVLPGPDSEVVRQAALAALQDYADATHAIGATVTLAGITASLFQAGVQNVTLTSPVADIVAAATEAPYLGTPTVTVG
ncbi:baseplate assembly protein [Kordiimonas marina]|uniref:baseplate assembly protein n=1 Tax=Kordiimonas marina TaxID=2872312 RepID=UPI001FF6C534|nr:baseplate J/gp47 family protein [Kordiimonas marina]MCJ9428545.1 baseplate J/gp47 family protein [Kordiimonas marina]